MKKVELKNQEIKLEYKNKYLKKIEWFSNLKNSNYKYWDNLIQEYILDCEECLEYIENDKIKYISEDILEINITYLISIYVNFVINKNLDKLDYATYKKLGLKYLKIDIFNNTSNCGLDIKQLLELKESKEINNINVLPNNRVSNIIHNVSGIKGTYKQKIKYEDIAYKTKLNNLFESLELNYEEDYITEISITLRYNRKSESRIIKGKLKRNTYMEDIFKGFLAQPNKDINNVFSESELKHIFKVIGDE